MRSLTELGLHPNLSAVVLHRLSADRQADPRTLVLPSTVKPLEGLEDLLPVFRLDADSIVGDPENPTLTVLLRCQSNHGLLIGDEF